MRIAIVGGIPNPIGGVTTFIRRIVSREPWVKWIFDLYPHEHKQLPQHFQGGYFIYSNKIFTVLRIIWFSLFEKADFIHFNFSSVRSLRLLKLIPKGKAKWLLTLHHGDLGDNTPKWALSVLKKKVNVAIALNERQVDWYKQFIPEQMISLASPYVKPTEPSPSILFQNQIQKLKKDYQNLLVCSGYPSKIYNHLLAIDLIKKRPKDVLICCLYGTGNLRAEIHEKIAETPNAFMFESLMEDDFNYLLSNSHLYLRLNSEDSFGIAVADAVNLGVPVMATNVCSRYQGSFIIDVPTGVESLLDQVENALTSKENLQVSSASINEFDYYSVLKDV